MMLSYLSAQVFKKKSKLRPAMPKLYAPLVRGRTYGGDSYCSNKLFHSVKLLSPKKYSVSAGEKENSKDPAVKSLYSSAQSFICYILKTSSVCKQRNKHVPLHSRPQTEASVKHPRTPETGCPLEQSRVFAG